LKHGLLWMVLAVAVRLSAMEGFESGLGAWSATGLWHRSVAPGCITPHEGNAVAYFGRDSSCDYNDGQIKDASLTSGPITLTSSANAYISFWLLYEVESLGPSCFDQLRLEWSPDGSNWYLLQILSPNADPVGGGPGVGMDSGSGLGGPPLWQFVDVDLSAFAPGTLYLRYRFISSAQLAGDPACLSTDAEMDNFLGIAIDEIRIAEADPLLSLSKSVSPPFGAPGTELTYTLVAKNRAAAAADLSLWDSLPAGLNFVAADAGGALNGSVVNWGPSTVPAGAALTLNLRVQADPSLSLPADIRNTGEGISTGGGGVTQRSSETLFKVRANGLQLSHSAAPSSIVSGDRATYNLLVENYTALTQTGLSLQMSLPGGLAYNGAYPALSALYRWDLAPLPPGQIRSFSLWGRGFGEDGSVLTARGTLSQGGVLAQKDASVTVTKPVEPSVTVKGVYPNPAPSDKPGLPQSAFVYYELNVDMPLQLDIFTIAGEKVRSIPAPGARGRSQVEWDLRNDYGNFVASGIYVFRLWSQLLVIPTPEATGFIAVAR
jgi:uncharacterized repeat protein (TIGR01451 family)